MKIQLSGGVAQLGERCVRNAEVRGSIPLISTKNQSADAHMHPRIFYFPLLYKAFRPFPFPPVSVRFRLYPRFYGISFGIRKQNVDRTLRKGILHAQSRSSSYRQRSQCH